MLTTSHQKNNKLKLSPRPISTMQLQITTLLPALICCSVAAVEAAVEKASLRQQLLHSTHRSLQECTGSDPQKCGCDSVDQVDYRGTLSVSESGLPCQRWDAQSPHKPFLRLLQILFLHMGLKRIIVEIRSRMSRRRGATQLIPTYDGSIAMFHFVGARAAYLIPQHAAVNLMAKPITAAQSQRQQQGSHASVGILSPLIHTPGQLRTILHLGSKRTIAVIQMESQGRGVTLPILGQDGLSVMCRFAQQLQRLP